MTWWTELGFSGRLIVAVLTGLAWVVVACLIHWVISPHEYSESMRRK